MSFQAYLDTVKAKTGKTPQDFIKLTKEKGLTKHADLLAWLKTDFGLGHGHANAIIHVINQAEKPKASADERVDKHFSGAKAAWRKPYDDLLETLKGFGADVRTAPTNSYISLLRKDKKFGIVQVTGKRMDIGIKLGGAAAKGRFEESGDWNAMVTHRVRIENAKDIDKEIISWLRKAYDKAG